MNEVNTMEKKNPVQKSEKTQESGKKLVVLLVRGTIGFSTEIKDTLKMLRLYKKNTCVLIPDTPSYKGMLIRIQSLVTWGEIDDSTLKELKEKREEKTKNHKGEELSKLFYRLHPPRGGFERKGIKLPFKLGGALGYRGAKINDLIKRML